MTQLLTSTRSALQVLKAFTTEHPEWGARELSSHLGWAHSTTHLLLSTLANEGFLGCLHGGVVTTEATQGRADLVWLLAGWCGRRARLPSVMDT